MGKAEIKKRVSELTNVPKDVLWGIPLFRMIGREEFHVENYRGILEYKDTLIRIQTKIGQVQLTGKNLEIIYYTNDGMKVEGYIEKLEFLQGGVL